MKSIRLLVVVLVLCLTACAQNVPRGMQEPGVDSAELVRKAEIDRLLSLAEIDRLLSLAEADLKATRLTTPEGNNAFEHYQAVLAMDRNNADARAGFDRIVDRYIGLSEAALDKEEFGRVEQYLSRASTVIPDAEVITSFKERTEAAKEKVFQKHMAFGRKALEDHNKSRAVSFFEAAFALYPEDASAREGLEKSSRAGLEKARAITDRPRHGDTFTNSLGMKFVFIGPGSFMMGSPSSEPGRYDNERQYWVKLTKGYWMQTTEVTQNQWKTVMGSNPSFYFGYDNPVESVSWNDTQDFIRKLNQREGKSYRLPTEAEWEYAARAGSSARFCFGDADSRLGRYAWYFNNSEMKTHPVGKKHPNSWGLYDMHGNVLEWCQDWYGDYPAGVVTDPAGPSSGSHRVFRGGSLINDPRDCRSAIRYGSTPGTGTYEFDQGFRLALSPVR